MDRSSQETNHQRNNPSRHCRKRDGSIRITRFAKVIHALLSGLATLGLAVVLGVCSSTSAVSAEKDCRVIKADGIAVVNPVAVVLGTVEAVDVFEHDDHGRGRPRIETRVALRIEKLLYGDVAERIAVLSRMALLPPSEASGDLHGVRMVTSGGNSLPSQFIAKEGDRILCTLARVYSVWEPCGIPTREVYLDMYEPIEPVTLMRVDPTTNTCAAFSVGRQPFVFEGEEARASIRSGRVLDAVEMPVSRLPQSCEELESDAVRRAAERRALFESAYRIAFPGE